MKRVSFEGVEFELDEGDYLVFCPYCNNVLQVGGHPNSVEECAFCSMGFAVGDRDVELVPYTED